MRKRIDSRLFFAVLLTLLVPVAASAQGISQFVASGNETGVNVHNPDEFEVLAILIGYDEDGSLSTSTSFRHDAGCSATLIPPHGNDDTEIFDNTGGDVWELIAIPTEGPHAGVFDRTESLGLGVYTNHHEDQTGATVPPRAFAPPADSGDLDTLMGCICCELDRLGLPANALQPAFGLNCSAANTTVTCDPPPA